MRLIARGSKNPLTAWHGMPKDPLPPPGYPLPASWPPDFHLVRPASAGPANSLCVHRFLGQSRTAPPKQKTPIGPVKPLAETGLNPPPSAPARSSSSSAASRCTRDQQVRTSSPKPTHPPKPHIAKTRPGHSHSHSHSFPPAGPPT